MSAYKTQNSVTALLRDRGLLTAMALAIAVNLGPALVFPILPLYAHRLGVGYAQTGILVGSFFFARLTFDIFSGLLVGRIGEKASAVAGFCILGAGALLSGLENSFWPVVITWAVAGAGSAVVVAAMFSYLLKAVPSDRVGSALSIFYGAFSLALIAGASTGGVIASGLGLTAPFLFLSAIAILAALLTLRFMKPMALRPPERQATSELDRSRPSPVRILLRTVRDNRVLVPTIVIFAELWLVGGAVYTLLPLFARDVLKATTLEVAVLFAIVLAAEFVSLYPAGRLIDSRGSRYVLVPSLAALAALSIVTGLATNLTLFIILLTLLGLASGFSSVPPVAILSSAGPTEYASTGVGVFRFGADLGLMLGPLVAGLTAGLGFGPAFAICGIPAFLALILVATTRSIGKIVRAIQ